ncbi:hypothetical protein E2C01_084940 [Portunus trituberculatus]|uniref:Uncharacterized protein n=1 Tax=Portunus trituberculatus TaxID=210409 RepID=A0A5B7JC80_PORTR|nr:hypothetical protein [Portunus trituberculatus]
MLVNEVAIIPKKSRHHNKINSDQGSLSKSTRSHINCGSERLAAAPAATPHISPRTETMPLSIRAARDFKGAGSGHYSRAALLTLPDDYRKHQHPGIQNRSPFILPFYIVISKLSCLQLLFSALYVMAIQ